jgi:hypothetical protein
VIDKDEEAEMASGNGTKPPTPGQRAKALKDEAEDLKLEQTLKAADAKEAEAALAEIEKDVAQWEVQRPAVEKMREGSAADLKRLQDDVQGLPETTRLALDKLIEKHDEDTKKLETETIPGAREALKTEQGKFDAATKTVMDARAKYDNTRAEGRKKALDQLNKLVGDADARYDNHRRAEAYMLYKLQDKLQIASGTEILESLPENTEAQKSALEKAYGDWLSAKEALRDRKLDLSKAKRAHDEYEAELVERKERRVVQLLGDAAKHNADAEKRGAPAAGAKPARGKGGQEAGAQRGA